MKERYRGRRLEEEKIELTDETMNIIEPALRHIFKLLMIEEEYTLSGALCATWMYVNALLIEAGVNDPDRNIDSFMNRTNIEQNKRMLSRMSQHCEE